MRELPKAIAKRIRLPRRRMALGVTIAAVVAVAITAAVVPPSIPGRAAAGSTPIAVAAGSIGTGRPSSETATASLPPTGNGYASGQGASPSTTPAGSSAPTETATAQPSPSASCVPAPYVSCDTIAAPTALPSADADATPFGLRVPILEYHRVKPIDIEVGYQVSLVVPPDLFAAQMDVLRAAGWQTITMGQLGDDLRSGVAPVPKSFVVTFDDGYRDGYLYAYPILQRDYFVATYFVIGSQIDRPDRLTISDLQTLRTSGNEIGNHSMSHEDMRYWPVDRLVTETFGASAVIARDVGVWPQSFSYPIGLTNSDVISVLSKCPGIQTSVIQGGSTPETWSNRFGLPRIRVGPGTNPQDLLQRLNRYLP